MYLAPRHDHERRPVFATAPQRFDDGFTRIGRWRYLLALCILTLCACDESDYQPAVIVDEHTGCNRIDPCPIGDRFCQEAVLDTTACVRGDETPTMPTIRTLSRAGLRRELNDNTANNDELSAEAAAFSRAVDAVYSALHLIAPKTTLSSAAVSVQSDGLAAFYRPEKKDITIISDTQMERVAAMNALSHEFTHYLQDLAGQLDVGRKTNISFDESVARRALIEGEAVVTSYRTTAALMGVDEADLQWTAISNGFEEAVTSATSSSTSPLLAASYRLPYVISSKPIESAWTRQGREAVDQLFEAPPLTQLQWLKNRALTDESVAEELDCYPALPPPGFNAIASDSLGVAGVFALLGALKMPSLTQAADWRQDRLAFYMSDDDVESGMTHALAVWRIRFDTEQHASLFAERIAKLELDISVSGRELLLSASNIDDDEALDMLDTEACPTLRDFAMAPRADIP